MSVDELAHTEKPAAPQPTPRPPSLPDGNLGSVPPHGGSSWVAWLMTLLFLAALGSALFAFRTTIYTWLFPPRVTAAAQSRPVAVITATARRADLPIYVPALGTVTAWNSVLVRTRVDGTLDTVAFTEGQTVEANALLAQIDPRPYQQQLEQAKGQLAKDQATLENDLANQKRLHEAGEAVSKLQLDAADAAVRQDRGVLVSDQANIGSAELNITYCRITSPLAGVIGLRVVDQGNMVHASDPSGLVVINMIEPIAVIFPVTEDALPRIQRAVAAGHDVKVEAYNRDLTAKLATGTLMALDNQIDPSSGTVRLKARFDNADHMLYPNQFVNVRLLVDTRKDVVLIPSAAVQHSPTATFVYRVKPGEKPGDKIVEMENVTEGPTEKPTPSSPEYTAITAGLDAGDEVVTDGVDKLLAGSKVLTQSAGGTTRPGGTRPAGAGGTRPAGSRPGGGGARPAGNVEAAPEAKGDR